MKGGCAYFFENEEDSLRRIRAGLSEAVLGLREELSRLVVSV